jgi:chromosome segregation ATPase
MGQQMKHSGKNTGTSRIEGKSAIDDASLGDEVFSFDDSEYKRKTKKKHRGAKSRGDDASHATAAEKELGETHQSVTALTAQIEETDALLGEVLQAAADLEAALNKMKDRCAESEAREMALERALELAEKAVQAGKEKIADLHAVHSRERQQNGELSDTLATLQNWLVIEQEHISALTVRAAAADANPTRERLQVESLNAILGAIESKLVDELTRAAKTECELRVARRGHEDVRRELEAIQAALSKEQLHASALAQDLAAARQAEEDLAQARADENAVREVLERREQEISALLNSTSWRLSAPWRVFRRQLSRVRRLLRGKKANPLFDRRWYVKQYRDVRESEIDAYDHYLRYGIAEGRNPNPLFDTTWYLQKNVQTTDK